MKKTGTPEPLDRLLSDALRDGRTPEVCPEAEQLAAFGERALDDGELAHVERHVADCARCAAVMSTILASEPPAAVVTSASWYTWRVWRWTVPAATAVLVAGVWFAATRPRGHSQAPEKPLVMASREESRSPIPGAQDSSPVAPAPSVSEPVRQAPQPAAPTAATPQRAASSPAAVESKEKDATLSATRPADTVALQGGVPLPPPSSRAGAPPAPDPESRLKQEAAPRPSAPSVDTGEQAGRKSSNLADASANRRDRNENQPAPPPAPPAAAATAAPPPAAPPPAAQAKAEETTATLSPTLPPPAGLAGGGAGVRSGVGGAGGGGGGRGGRGGGRAAAGAAADALTVPEGQAAPATAAAAQNQGRIAVDGVGLQTFAPIVLRNTAGSVMWRLQGVMVERSTDAGATWSPVFTAPRPLAAGAVAADDTVWLVGAGGLVVRGTATGWAVVTSPAPIDLTGVSQVTTRGATVRTRDGRDVRTDDAGATWK